MSEAVRAQDIDRAFWKIIAGASVAAACGVLASAAGLDGFLVLCLVTTVGLPLVAAPWRSWTQAADGKQPERSRYLVGLVWILAIGIPCTTVLVAMNAVWTGVANDHEPWMSFAMWASVVAGLIGAAVTIASRRHTRYRRRAFSSIALHASILALTIVAIESSNPRAR